MDVAVDVDVLLALPRRARLRSVAELAARSPASGGLAGRLLERATGTESAAEGSGESAAGEDPLEPEVGRMLAPPRAMVPEGRFEVLDAAFVAAAAGRDGTTILHLTKSGSRHAAKRALVLATHVSEAVSDAELRGVFDAAKEADKFKILRTAARDKDRRRAGFLDAVVGEWLGGGRDDERRVVACEVLYGCSPHVVKRHVREVMLEGERTATTSKRKALRAVRFADLWRRHSDVLLELLQEEFRQPNDHLHNLFVWTLWSAHALRPAAWLESLGIPTTSQPHVQRFSRAIPWLTIYQLWRDFLPVSCEHGEALYQLQLQPEDQGKLLKASNPTKHTLLLALLEDSRKGKLSLVAGEERFVPFLPAWFFNGYLSPNESVFFVEFAASLVVPLSTGALVGVPTHHADVWSHILTTGLDSGRLSSDKYRLVLGMFQRVSECMTPALFYGLSDMPRTSHASVTEYEARRSLFQTFTVLQGKMKAKFFDPDGCQLTTGELLESYGVVLAFHKRMLFKAAEAFPQLMPPAPGGVLLSLFVTPDKAYGMVDKHAKWISNFTDAVVRIVGNRLVRALDKLDAVAPSTIPAAASTQPMPMNNLQVVFHTLVQGHVTTYEAMCASLVSIQDVFPMFTSMPEPAFTLAATLGGVSSFSPDKHKIGSAAASEMLVGIVLARCESTLTEAGVTYEYRYKTSKQVDEDLRKAEALNAVMEQQARWMDEMCSAMSWLQWTPVAEERILAWMSRVLGEALDMKRRAATVKKTTPVFGADLILAAVKKNTKKFLTGDLKSNFFMSQPVTSSLHALNLARFTDLGERCVRLWAQAELSPTKEGNPVPVLRAAATQRGPIHPTTHLPFLELVFTLPVPIKERFETQFVRPMITLMMRGEYETPLAASPSTSPEGEEFPTKKLPTYASKGRNATKMAWTDAINHVMQGFSRSLSGYASEDLDVREAGFKARIVEHMERVVPGAVNDLRDTFDELFSVTDSAVRKRLEIDLVKSPDRVKAFQVLVKATVNSHQPAELSKTLNKVLKAMSTEQQSNKRAMMDIINSILLPEILSRALPDPCSGNGANDVVLQRKMAARIYTSGATAEEFAETLAQAEILSSTVPPMLLRMVDLYYGDQEEKTPADHAVFEDLARVVLKMAMAWPFFRSHAQIQQRWVDVAVELKTRVHGFTLGKAMLASTFVLGLGTDCISTVSQMVFEQGACPDWDMPRTSEEVREFQLESRARRLHAASHVAELVHRAYESVLGKPGLGLSPEGGFAVVKKSTKSVERARFEEVLRLVRGAWRDIPFLREFVNAAVGSLDNAAGTALTETQVVELHGLMRDVNSITLEWCFAEQDYHPAWFSTVPGVGSEGRRPNLATPHTGTRVPGKQDNDKPATAKGKRSGGVKRGRGSVRKAHAPPSLPESRPWFAWSEVKFVSGAVVRYMSLCLRLFGVHHPAGVAEGRAILRAWLRARMGSPDIVTREQRLGMRDAVVMDLLGMCDSAVHLSIVQGHLMERRQELMRKYVVDKPAQDPILGKFSPAAPSTATTTTSAALDASELPRPFRLRGVYGFENLFARDCADLALRLLDDAKSADVATKERITSVAKLRFMPSVDPVLLMRLYEWHMDQSEKLEAREKEAKEQGVSRRKLDEASGEPGPLPEGVVATTLRALFQHDNPYKALAMMLRPRMLHNTSTKETSAVALRVLHTLSSDQVVDLCRVVLSRRGRDTLRVGPFKVFLNILHTLAKNSPSASRAGAELLAVWGRRVASGMHVDAQSLLCGMALSSVASSGPPPAGAGVEWAWSIVESIATDDGVPAEVRLLLIRLVPPASAIALVGDTRGDMFKGATMSTSFSLLVDKASSAVDEVVLQEVSPTAPCPTADRYVDLMLRAVDVLEREGSVEVPLPPPTVNNTPAEEGVGAGGAGAGNKGVFRERVEAERRKQAARDVRAALLAAVCRFAGCVNGDVLVRLLKLLGGLVTGSLGDAHGAQPGTAAGEQQEEALHKGDAVTRTSIVDVVLPRHLGWMCSHVFLEEYVRAADSLPEGFVVSTWLAEEVLTGIVALLMGPLSVEVISRREKMSQRLDNLLRHVSEKEKRRPVGWVAPPEGAPRPPPLSLWYEAVQSRFEQQIALLKREAAVAAAVKHAFAG